MSCFWLSLVHNLVDVACALCQSAYSPTIRAEDCVLAKLDKETNEFLTSATISISNVTQFHFQKGRFIFTERVKNKETKNICFFS